MKFGGKSILWSAIALVLLLSMGVPLLNWLTVAFIMVPYVLLYTTLSKRMFIAHLVPALLIAFVVVGLPSLIIGLFFLIPAVVMGSHYRRDRPVGRTMTATMLTILGLILLELLAFEAISGVSLIRLMQDQLRDILGNLSEQGMAAGIWTSDNIEAAITLSVQSIPQMLLLMAFVVTAVTQFLSRRVLKRAGIIVNGLPPAREWQVPRVLVVYYLITLFLQMFMTTGDGSFLSVAVMNLEPLLKMVFTIQAIGFFFYLAHQRGWARPVPVLIGIILLIFPPLSLIGVLDAAFPIRKSFQKKS